MYSNLFMIVSTKGIRKTIGFRWGDLFEENISQGVNHRLDLSYYYPSVKKSRPNFWSVEILVTSICIEKKSFPPKF